VGKRECRYVETALDVEYVYSQLHRTFTSSPHTLTPSHFISALVGSPQLRKHLAEVRTASGHLSLLPEVSRLVDTIWTEANDQLEDVLAVAVETVTLEQLDKAEAALLSIRRELDSEAEPRREGGRRIECSVTMASWRRETASRERWARESAATWRQLWMWSTSTPSCTAPSPPPLTPSHPHTSSPH
jgi:hypothetical protein